jgi:hypothetical protein
MIQRRGGKLQTEIRRADQAAKSRLSRAALSDTVPGTMNTPPFSGGQNGFVTLNRLVACSQAAVVGPGR